MSLNVGIHQSKFVYASNPEIRFAYSDKVIFVKLRTSSKTGRFVMDGDKEKLDSQGNRIPERKYSYFDARFVGNAFEAAKGFNKPTAIDIIDGWIDSETFKGVTSYYVVVSDFSLSELIAGDEVDVESPSDLPSSDGDDTE